MIGCPDAGRLSITAITLSNVVPYFAYSSPGSSMTARTSYSPIIAFQKGCAFFLPSAAPPPKIATSLPPGCSRSMAERTCR